MKTLILILVAILTIVSCRENSNNNIGVLANTLVADGTNIAVTVNCQPQACGGNSLKVTASDVTAKYLLRICFVNEPTTTQTLQMLPGGSSAAVTGTYSINGNDVYEIQSGSITVTPETNGFRTFTFNNVPAKTGKGVLTTLSFRGTCK